jgi:hypothetical protein
MTAAIAHRAVNENCACGKFYSADERNIKLSSMHANRPALLQGILLTSISGGRKAALAES